MINRAEELIGQIRNIHRAEVQEHVDVLRALILFACDHTDINDLGYKWLQSLVIDDEELGIYGFRQRNQTPSRIVRGLSWLLSLTGCTVLALDQLDAIVAEHALARGEPSTETSSDQQRRSLAIIQSIASGLIELRDVTRRTLSVVSSLEATWDILDGQTTVSMADRFDTKLLLKPGTGPAVYRELVSRRLRVAYEPVGFAPPYASYPYAEAFFERFRHNTPRELLKECEAHRKLCKKAREVIEAPGVVSEDVSKSVAPNWVHELTQLVERERSQVNLSLLLSDDSETLQDKVVEALCEALVLENPVPESVFTIVDKDFMGTGNYDPLHARVRLVLTNQQERERHHSFRFLEKSHHSAFQSRLKAALTASGIDQRLSFRGLTILRCSALPSGAATAKLVADLESRGGRIVAPSEKDLATLVVIQRYLRAAHEPEHFEEWLAAKRPVSNMPCFAPIIDQFFGAVNNEPNVPSAASTANAASATNAAPLANTASVSDTTPANLQPTTVTTRASSPPDVTAPTVAAAVETQSSPITVPPVAVAAVTKPAGHTLLPIGRRLAAGEPQEEVGIQVERLPYHTCVFAGSGSGKTVFLKRVIEEAALLGIPSIVIDGANDLSRLGMAWPTRPAAFSDEDEQKAQLYNQKSEVVVWTPGASNGNPMRLNPLPDFTAVAKTPSERETELQAAIEVATSSIGDLIIRGRNAARQTAILKATLRYFALRGGSIRDLVTLLREPPEDVTEPYEKGDKLARELSELLHAAIENDPLIGGSGTPLDPAVLFRASDPNKT